MQELKKKEWVAARKKYGDSFCGDYERLHERLLHAEAQVKEHGALVAAPNGFPAKNPWLAVAEKARAEMRVMEKMVFAQEKVEKKGKKEEQQEEAESTASASVFKPSVPPLRAVR